MSVTVHGCVKWTTSPPEIYFLDLETCLEQSACIIWTGEHAGQVALTLSGADDEDCNDTFYSTCVDFTTGRFEVVIPEDCCVTHSEVDCEYCDAGKTPYQIDVYFSPGFHLCFDCYSPTGQGKSCEYEFIGDWGVFSGGIRATQSIGGSCHWVRELGDSYKIRHIVYNDIDCGGGVYSSTDYSIVLRVYKHYNESFPGVLIRMFAGVARVLFIGQTTDILWGCMNAGDIENIGTGYGCHCGPFDQCCEGGYATIIEV